MTDDLLHSAVKRRSFLRTALFGAGTQRLRGAASCVRLCLEPEQRPSHLYSQACLVRVFRRWA